MSFSLFASCECATRSQGHVYDAVTLAPLDSVRVRSFTTPDNYLKQEMYTGSNGLFTASTGFKTGKCKELKVIFHKEGYKDLTVIYTAGQSHENQSVHLELE